MAAPERPQMTRILITDDHVGTAEQTPKSNTSVGMAFAGDFLLAC
jgi:hypothetical protein